MQESTVTAGMSSGSANNGGGRIRQARDTAPPRLGTNQVWRALERTSNAVLGHVTPTGTPRTSGVVYAVVDRRLYIAVAPDSWKARHIATGDQVSVTALVHRGGLLSLIFPIPPATISLHGQATLYPPGSEDVGPLLTKLVKLLPPERRDSATLIEVAPEGFFLTYGIGVSLTAMRRPERARARVPVGPIYDPHRTQTPTAVGRQVAARTPRLPPRWFIRLAWKVHRALFEVTGGRRGLWPAQPQRWGALRLTTTGRRSGRERPVILGYIEDGPNLVTMAMNGWGEGEPAWWLNLQAHPRARVQLANGTREISAHIATGPERDRLWNRWRTLDKNLDGYARRRSTETAVVVLEPVD